MQTALPLASPFKELPTRDRLTRAEDLEQRRELLLAAAWAVLGERGFQDMTLEHVAQRAGFSRRPIYTLFGSKERLALALYQRLLSHTSELTTQISPARTLTATMGRYARMLADFTQDPSFAVQRELGSAIALLAVNDDVIREAVGGMVEAHRSDLLAWLTECEQRCSGSFRLPTPRVAILIEAGIAGLIQTGTYAPECWTEPLFRDLLQSFIA